MARRCPVPTRNWKILMLVLSFVFVVGPLSFIFSSTTSDSFKNFRNLVGESFSEAVSFNNTVKAGAEEPRIAICLVGEARRFELTGASLVDRVINVFSNSDLFLHCPFDKDSYKLSLLKGAHRIMAVRIFEQKPMPETEEVKQILTGEGSPNGVQGLLQYFNLVEGCVAMIHDYQTKNMIQYDWIVRTRVDAYWSAPLSKSVFIPGTYVVPSGLEYYGLNDRFGAGDLNTSWIALSRLKMLRRVHAAGHRLLGSETFLRAQLGIQNIKFQQLQIPFCIISDHKFMYPPSNFGTLVTSISSQSPLSGAYCRPCPVACKGECASKVLESMARNFGWIDGEPELCDGSGEWSMGWEPLFDHHAGEKYASARKSIGTMDLDRCIADLESMKSRTGFWDAPSPEEICRVRSVKETKDQPKKSIQVSEFKNFNRDSKGDAAISGIRKVILKQLQSGELIL